MNTTALATTFVNGNVRVEIFQEGCEAHGMCGCGQTTYAIRASILQGGVRHLALADDALVFTQGGGAYGEPSAAYTLKDLADLAASLAEADTIIRTRIDAAERLARLR